MLIKSQLLSVMSGSLDASVASHNRFGRYLRAKVIPTNPNTNYQVAVREAMTQLVERWTATLTAAQRTQWETYAANVPMTNRVGDTIYLTGLNHYIRSNVPRLQNTLPIVDAGPVDLTLPSFTPVVVSADASDNALSVALTNTDAWATEQNGALIVQATRPQSLGVNFNALPFRLAGIIAGASPTPPTSPGIISPPWDLIGQAGNVVFVRARISRADGRLSAAFTQRVIIQA